MTDIPKPAVGDTSWDDWATDEEEMSDAVREMQAGMTYAPAPTGGDDLAALTAALASSTVVALRPGLAYLVSNTLSVPAGKTLTGLGSIAPLTPGSPPTFLVGLNNNSTIRDVTLRDSTAYGAYVLDSNDTTIVNCSFQQINGYAILVEGASARTKITGNRIRHTTATQGQGATVKGIGGGIPTDTSITNNTVEVHGVLGLEAQLGARGVTFTGNVVNGSDIGISASNVSGATVSGNMTYGCKTYGIEAAGSNDFAITGNTTDGAGLAGAIGIALTGNPGSSYGTVVGNTVRGIPSTGTGVRAVWPTQTNCMVTITGNVVNTASHCIYVTKASGMIVVGNMLDGAGTAVSAVEIESCTDMVIANNQAHRFTGAAVNAYTGTIANIILGPNLLSGGTPTQLINGPLGTGSRTV